jgi:hypothetical protein
VPLVGRRCPNEETKIEWLKLSEQPMVVLAKPNGQYAANNGQPPVAPITMLMRTGYFVRSLMNRMVV